MQELSMVSLRERRETEITIDSVTNREQKEWE